MASELCVWIAWKVKRLTVFLLQGSCFQVVRSAAKDDCRSEGLAGAETIAVRGPSGMLYCEEASWAYHGPAVECSSAVSPHLAYAPGSPSLSKPQTDSASPCTPCFQPIPEAFLVQDLSSTLRLIEWQPYLSRLPADLAASRDSHGCSSTTDPLA